MVMALLEHWKLSTEDQAALLGIAASNRAALSNYRSGKPIGTSRDQYERVGHLCLTLVPVFPYGYNLAMSNNPKPLHWVGSSKKDLLAMPDEVVDVFGYALHLAQAGKKHDQAKAMKGFGGASVLEVVEDYMGDTYRAVYTVKIAERVYVLHCFQKKSTKGIETPKHEMDLIRERLKAALAHAKGA